VCEFTFYSFFFSFAIQQRWRKIDFWIRLVVVVLVMN
jgi:hypothetical protein